jgi:hypothetical protein
MAIVKDEESTGNRKTSSKVSTISKQAAPASVPTRNTTTQNGMDLESQPDDIVPPLFQSLLTECPPELVQSRYEEFMSAEEGIKSKNTTESGSIKL